MSSSDQDTAVVIPTNRQIDPLRLRHIPEDVPIFVVNDGQHDVRPTRPGMQVFDSSSIRSVMGPDADLIPRRTAACRNFGFYYIWKYTGHTRIVSIDDDVETRLGFLDGYDVLGTVCPMESVRGVGWFNTIELFDNVSGILARGFPYEERPSPPADRVVTTARVVAHMGLWDGVLDTHALDKWLFGEYQREYGDALLTRDVVRIGAGDGVVHFPLSSMSFGFLRETLPVMYQMPMGHVFGERHALGRYDDIWAGYIAQSLIARRGDAFTAGAPIVRHVKAGDLRAEMCGEHYGILLSPCFYRVVDLAVEAVPPGPYAEMYAALCDRVLTFGDTTRRALFVPPHFWNFIESLFRCLLRWTTLCLATLAPV